MGIKRIWKKCMPNYDHHSPFNLLLFLLLLLLLLLLQFHDASSSVVMTTTAPNRGKGEGHPHTVVLERLECNDTGALKDLPFFVKAIYHAVHVVLINAPSNYNHSATLAWRVPALKEPREGGGGVRMDSVYAMGRCLPPTDMSSRACHHCLREVGENLLELCGTAVGGNGMRPLDGCSLRYQIFKFF